MPCARTIRSFLWIAILLAVTNVGLFSSPPEDRRLTIYSLAANYSLTVYNRNGQDYISLLEAVDPLGEVRASSDGSRWKLRYNNIDCEFTPGSSHARIQKADIDLHGNFVLENGRGLVPIATLNILLAGVLGGPVTMHEASRRVFIGNAAVHFTAQINKQATPALVMNFTSPVNPMIATEPGKLNMIFSREALVAPGSPSLTFDDRTIPSANYHEENGAAIITVNGDAPLFASYSNGNRTITIAPAPQPSAQNSSPGPQLPASTTPLTPPTPIRPAGSQFIVVVDASHGGEERGEAITAQIAEKDITLTLARSFRQELQNRGLTAVLLRDGDMNLTLDQRAVLTNLKRPILYVSFHATAQGEGVRLYTALLPADGEDKGPFLDWNTAQAALLPLSKTAAAVMASELQKKQIAVRSLSASLRPLNNVTTAAIAIEVAPSPKGIADLTSYIYQQQVTSSVAAAVFLVRDKLEANR